MQEAILSKSKSQYKKDGIVFPVKVLTASEVKKYKEAFDEMENYYNGFLPRAGWTHAFFDWAFDLVNHPAILSIVKEMIGPEVIVQGSLFLNKYPNSAAFFPWHQDGLHSKLEFSQSTTVWLALSESTVENGCMKVIAGTHESAWMEHKNIKTKNSMLKNGGEITEGLDESKARNVILKPGEMSIHQNSIVHGSMPNTSNKKRTCFIIRYSTPAYQGSTPVIQVAGNALCNHLKVIKKPMLAYGEDPYVAHKSFINEQGGSIGRMSS